MNKKTLTHFSIRYGFLIIMVLLFIFFSITRPVFLTPSNLLSILLGLTIYAILALGETFPLIVNGMDLSIGAIASLSVMVSSYCMVILELKGYYAIIICLLMGATIGLINGLLIVKLKIPDLLTTLGMMFLVQGLQLIPSAGRSIGNGMSLPNGETAKGVFDEGFKFLGQGRLFDIIPIPVAFMFIIAVIVFIVLSLTRYGRIFYAIGGNSEAARLVGVNIYKYRILAYIISGFVASFAGIVLAARVGRGDVSSGGTLLMDAIASALIGYAVLGAQKPNPFGTIVGAIFIKILLKVAFW